MTNQTAYQLEKDWAEGKQLQLDTEDSLQTALEPEKSLQLSSTAEIID